MRNVKRVLACALLALGSACAGVFACSVPPTPPPPPPAPPEVCCVPVLVRAIPQPPPLPPRYIVIYRYFRRDGGPLYQSNPMPLFQNQRCLCTIWVPRPILFGGQLLRFSFGQFNEDFCDTIPDNLPPYGGSSGWEIEPIGSPSFQQALQFNQVYANAAGIPAPSAKDLLVLGFRAPGATIPPDSFFDIFVEVELPPGLSPDFLREGGAPDMAVGVFLEENGQVFAEPQALGLPPVPFGPFAMNPGASAFYKIRPYRWTGPLCVAPVGSPCPSDLNGDGVTNSSDLAVMLGSWGLCP